MLDIVLDKLNGHATEGKVCKIHINVGDEIKLGDKICDIEGKKGNSTFNSNFSGIIESIEIGEGDTVRLGDVVAKIEGVEAAAASEKTEQTKEVGGFNYFSSIMKPRKEEIECDIAILGGGPGGYVAAIQGAKLGAKVVLIEKENLGGTCLNRGCIPTKTLVRSAEVYENLLKAEDFGLYADNVSVNMRKVIARKDNVVDELRGGIGYILEKHGIRVIKAEGRLLDTKTLFAKEGNREITIKAKDIILATGSKAIKLPISGADSKNVITSDEALTMDTLPKKMIIIGGGIIGMEFAFIYSKFGVDVYVVEYFNSILANLDEDVIAEITAAARDNGIKLFTGSKVEEIIDGADNQSIVVFTKDGEKKYISADKVLMAVGRTPVFEGLDIEKLGIKSLENKKGIAVNEKLQTTVENIYAIGDLTNIIQLAHIASHQGVVAVKNIMGKELSMDYTVVPSAIFTHPEIATVGISEKDAEKQGLEIEVGKFPFAANGKALTYGERAGFVKLIKEKNTDIVLGGAVIGPHATDLIAEIALAVKNKLKIDQITETIHAHPTTAEAIHEGALALEGGSLHFVN
ncbi:dihydrolipoyl dehydrogenase [Clostridium sp. CX1]|uniref:dihydrolipoyl dehydrogenase n=1 Tax=Clostridium sp. CX1 TaxID=2978346 RepID=UPI0021BF168D|nr:dihydrolipoyl dehydrogenase [Clostridium sp. CX1]MCT8977682.1 dihydrolipoyl dehydrogenase [Clostridium sp. CX1]